MARFYTWRGGSGQFGDSTSWNDNSNGGGTDGTVPGSADTATVNAGTIGGSGTVDTFQIGGSATIAGTVTALTRLNYTSGTLTIAATGDLTAPYLAVPAGASGLVMQAGGALHATGIVRNSGTAAFYDALFIGSTASVTGATLDAAAGQLAIGGTSEAASLTAQGGATITSWTAVVGGGEGQGGSALLTGSGTRWTVAGGAAPPGNPSNTGGYALVGSGFPNGSGTTGTLTVTSGAEFDSVSMDVGVNAGASGTLSVSGGGTLSSTGTGRYSFLGNAAGSAGTATIDGAGSSWSSAGVIIVGNAGAGTLVVSNGASVSAATQLLVGQTLGGAGTLTIESGGVVSTAGSIEVGNGAGATGTVEVLAGGTLATTGPQTVVNYALTIGNAAGTTDSLGGPVAAATGSVLVSGTGSLLNLNGNGIRIGARGHGSLSVLAGGSVSVATENSASLAAAGIASNGSGTLLVSGAGSHFSADGGVYVAHAGTGTLTVASNATLTAGNATSGLSIGSGGTNGTGGSGFATVTAGGYLQADYGIFVGGGGDSGSLDVSGGGTVESTGRFVVGYGSTIDGTLVAGTGVVTVGAGSTLLADGTNITSSGTSAIQIGAAAGDSASVSVSGAAALMEAVGHYISIGSNGAGSLSVTQGGTVEASTDFVTNLNTYDAATYLGSNATGVGTLTVDGSGSAYDATGQISVGVRGRGTLVVQNQGTANSGNYDGNLGIIVADATTGVGSVLVTGTGALLSNLNGRFTVGNYGTGSMTVADGAAVTTTRTISATLDNFAGAYVGNQAHSSGSVTVTGTHSLWSVATNLLVGYAGTGVLDVRGSGAVRVGTTLGLGLASTGAGSITLDSTGMIEVGGTAGAVGGAIVVDTVGVLKGHGRIAAVVRNAGTVDAAGGTMVLTGAATGAGGYTIEPGAVLELGAAAGNTANILFDGGGTLRLDTPGAFAGTISVGTSGGTVDVAGDSGATAHVVGGDTLVVSGGAGTFDYALVGAPGLAVTTTGDGASGTDVVLSTDIAPTCYVEGTRIRTPGGEVAVEALVAGEMVSLHPTGAARVKWIGYRRIVCADHRQPRDVWPVRIEAGAFGGGLPHRALNLSPDHSVLVDGVLIPVRYLVNDATITQEPRRRVAYWHVELDRHDVLVAEGLPCESYLDTGNRCAFSNGGPVVQMHADFAWRVWAAEGCAPIVVAGAELVAARSHLLEQAGRLGHRMTDEPALRVLARGVKLGTRREGGTFTVRLPRGTDAVRLASRHAVPAHLWCESDDHRRLGVAIGRVAVDGVPIALDDPRLGAGWHPVEHSDQAGGWRWTDGDACLDVAGAHELAFDVAIEARYWLDPCGDAAGALRAGA